MSTDLDDLLVQTKIQPLTHAEYERIVKLEKALKVFGAELKTLKDRAKAYYEQEHGLVKGTEEHAGADFEFDVVQTKDLKATAEKFPISENPDKWVTPEPVLDLNAIAPKDIVTTPALRLTVKGA